ncbi:MAG: lamin tail domain-containing protein [Bacteroidales bacterium]
MKFFTPKRVAVISGFLFLYAGAANAQASDLLISEYVEGQGDNQAIELFNGTGKTVSLSEYSIVVTNILGGAAFTQVLSGELAHGATYVITNALENIITNEQLQSDAIKFNGNHFVDLLKNGEVIDRVGTEEWPADGSGKNRTLQRKAEVSVPKLIFNQDEWNVLTRDDISGLGSHEFSGATSIDRPEEMNTIKISGAKGVAVIEAAMDATVRIYQITGQLFREVNVTTGATRISLPAGIYIVQGTKIVVS